MTSGEPSRHAEGAQGGGAAPGLPAQYLRLERLDGPDLTILVIDDDRADRKLVRRLISAFSAEATVSEADSMELAPDIDAAEFDGIFLDNMLPGRTGVECLSALRARWPRAAIFLMTSHGDEILAKTAILSGATDYIAKSALSRNSVSRMLVNGVQKARAAWKLEQQHRDLSTFSEVLVHDFRAPIRAAVFLSEQIEEDLSDGAMDEARAGLQILRKSSQQMLDLITSLSDHNRLDREMRRDAVRPSDLVERALAALACEIAGSDARIVLDLDEAPEWITCDPPQIVQVIQNLVANALKYSGDAIPEINIAAVPSGKTGALFEIEDNGIGIDERYRERVFEPFRRIEGTRPVSGSGLGLATCRKILTRHDGRIWCEESASGGSVFRFFIPSA
jgi:signal transduction histidine kinase